MSDEVQNAQAAAVAAAEEAERLQAAAQEAILKAQQAAELARAAAEAQVAAAAAEAVDAGAAPDADSAAPAAASVPPSASGPLDPQQVEAIRAGYAFSGAALEMGALVNGEALADVQVRIPLAMINRHGLVAGATGTGKTRTLQVLAEQLSARTACRCSPPTSRATSPASRRPGDVERQAPRAHPRHRPGLDAATRRPTEYFTLGGVGTGVPIRATVAGFGPLLLSKVLGLNDTQESSLGLVFHYADEAGLPLARPHRPARRAHLPRQRRGQGRARRARRALAARPSA